MKNLVVLISGNGSNLQAIIDATQEGGLLHSIAKISLVISNKKDAYGLVRAMKAGIPTFVPNSLKTFKDAGFTRKDYDIQLAQELKKIIIPDLIVLAGWMHILSTDFLNYFPPGNIINLHPALPGQFDGARAIERAFEAFKRLEITKTGVMVHRVIAEVDRGDVILSREIDIEPMDTLETLENKIHEIEHIDDSFPTGQIQKLCREVLADLKNYQTENGRQLAALFLSLPPRKIYPDYYFIIKEPLSIACISDKVEKDAYISTEDFLKDLKAMFDNARRYNLEGSEVYSDACKLEEIATTSINSKQASLATTKSKKPKKDDQILLFEAIEKSDLKALMDLLRKPTVDVNGLRDTFIFQAPFAWSPLQCAAFYGRTKVIPPLMDAGANIEFTDSTYHGSPLAWSAFNNQFKAALLLVRDYHANIHCKNADGMTPFDLLPLEAHENAQWWDLLVEDKPLPRISVQDYHDNNDKLLEQMTMIYHYIVDLKDKTGRVMSDIFMELPSRKEYPTYYSHIKNPIALKIIAKKLAMDDYTDLDEFTADFNLMFDNAKSFNPPATFVHEDAKSMQLVFEKAIIAARKGALKSFLSGTSDDVEDKITLKIKTAKPKVTLKLPAALSVESLTSVSSSVENENTINQTEEDLKSKLRRRSAPFPKNGGDNDYTDDEIIDKRTNSTSDSQRRATFSTTEMQKQAIAAQFTHNQRQSHTFMKVDEKGQKKRLSMLEKIIIDFEDGSLPFVYEPSCTKLGFSLSLPSNTSKISLISRLREEVEDPEVGFRNTTLQTATLNHKKMTPNTMSTVKSSSISGVNCSSVDNHGEMIKYSVNLEYGSNIMEIECTAQVDESFAVANWNPQLNKYVQNPNGQMVTKTREVSQVFSIVLMRL